MSIFHDEVEIEDFDYNEDTETYTFTCPCGDVFRITRDELCNGEDIARCPSCSLILRVIYDPDAFVAESEEEEEEEEEAGKATAAATHPAAVA